MSKSSLPIIFSLRSKSILYTGSGYLWRCMSSFGDMSSCSRSCWFLCQKAGLCCQKCCYRYVILQIQNITWHNVNNKKWIRCINHINLGHLRLWLLIHVFLPNFNCLNFSLCSCLMLCRFLLLYKQWWGIPWMGYSYRSWVSTNDLYTTFLR